MSYSNVEINFAAQEPEGPTGRGRRESRQTAKMGDYVQDLAKNRMANERRQTTIAQKRRSTATVPPQATPAKTTGMSAVGAGTVTGGPSPHPNSPIFTSPSPASFLPATAGGNMPALAQRLVTPQYGMNPDPHLRQGVEMVHLTVSQDQLTAFNDYFNNTNSSGVPLQGTTHTPTFTEDLLGIDNIGGTFSTDISGAFDGYPPAGSEIGGEDEETYHGYEVDDSTANIPALTHITVSDDLLHNSAKSLSQHVAASQTQVQLVPRAADHRPQGTTTRSLATTQSTNHENSTTTALTPSEKRPRSQVPQREKENEPDETNSADSDSATDIETQGHDATTVDKPTKSGGQGRRKKRKITRGDQLGDSTRTRLVERAYPYMRARIACGHGFPGDDLKALFTRESFADARQEVARLGFDLGETSASITLDEADLIEDRISQTRGELRKIVCNKLPQVFLFKHVGAHRKEETTAQNRALYAKLVKDNAFFYRNPDNIKEPNTVYRQALIEDVIKEMWFHNEGDVGVKCRSLFDESGRLPLQCVALVITAIRFALDEWKTGERKPGRSGIKFTDKDYGPVYVDHLASLQSWYAYTSSPGRSNATALWQKSLLENGLAHAGVSVLVDQTLNTARLTEDIWANNDG